MTRPGPVSGLRRRELVLAGAAAAAVLARPPVALAATGGDDGAILLGLIGREESARFAAESAWAAIRYQTSGALSGFDVQEAEHAKALRTQLDALGRKWPPPPAAAAQLDAPARRVVEAAGVGGSTARLVATTLAAWIELEASLLRDYHAAVIRLGEPSILRTVATILASHAQHHALLRQEQLRDPS